MEREQSSGIGERATGGSREVCIATDEVRAENDLLSETKSETAFDRRSDAREAERSRCRTARSPRLGARGPWRRYSGLELV